MFNSPFLNPYITRNVSSSLLKTSKFSFGSIITGLEKTVSTINQIIPIYTQVKPLVSTSKSFFTNASKLLKRSKKATTNLQTPDNTRVINVEAKEVKKKETNTNINVTSPYKPFFI